MMDALINQVGILVEEEYARAAKQHGPNAASAHEGCALIEEELEEAQDEMEQLGKQMYHFWVSVKVDDKQVYRHYLEAIKKKAILAACELIQVAAMAEKTMGITMGEK